MQRRFHTLVVVFLVLLTVAGLLSTAISPIATPARAQVVTPDPSPPSFANQRFIIGSDNITNPAEGNPPTFAIADLPDPNAFPAATVHVHNYEGFADDQRFWLSVRIRQQDPGVEVVPEPGYAQMALIAPGGNAIYTVTYPPGASSRVEFEVDGSTDEAVMLTLLQFALDAGFTAAELTGLGAHDAEIGLELADIVADQYLADLPTLTPCANAVAAVQRGLTDQEQFTRDMQGCLESPIWQTSVDQVMTRVAERDWFQQSLNAAGMMMPAVSTALRAVKATQFAVQVWGMYEKFHPEVPGAMVGTVAFLSIDTTSQETLGAATAVPGLSVFEVVGRAQVAIEEAATYRYQTFTVDSAGRVPGVFGEVDIQEGDSRRLPDSENGEVVFLVFASGKLYAQLQDSSWEDRTPPTIIPPEPLVNLLNTRGQDWILLGVEAVDGQPAYAMERTFEYKGMQKTETVWIDSTSFLPLKLIERYGEEASSETERTYSDFGQPVDVQVPPEAIDPTPTPEPASPLTSSSPTAIAEGLLDAVFANDFERARQYFAPDRQPATMRALLGYPNGYRGRPEDGPILDQFIGCNELEYTAVERQGQQTGIQISEVVFVFLENCAHSFDVVWERQPSNRIGVVLDDSLGSWYVTRIWVLSP